MMKHHYVLITLLFLFLVSNSKTALADTPNCYGIIGSGNIAQPGSSLQDPTLIGNFQRSYRSQLLYTSIEVDSALLNSDTIYYIAFNIAIFNSNAYAGFTVKMGHTSADSLITWYDTLQTVASYSAYGFAPGWNKINLSSPFAWNGQSNLVIEVCCYSFNIFGVQLNKFQCTNMPFSSYLYASSHDNLCGLDTLGTSSTLRPNVKLYDCAIVTDIPQFQSSTLKFQIYPNAASNSVNISVGEELIGSTLSLTDLTGREIMAVQLQTTNNKLETTNLANGIYFITVRKPGTDLTQKLVIQR